jgi:hypothetical protein
MDSLLPPDWGRANYRDRVSRKQVEYYYNKKLTNPAGFFLLPTFLHPASRE